MNVALRLAEAHAETLAAKPPSRIAVLVVDDDAAKRLATVTLLKPLGYTIVEADSGAEALRCVLRQTFAVILLDVRMPIMDGFETAALIRQRPQSEMTPLIFITSYAKDESVHPNLYAAGAVDFIFAPIAAGELQAKVSAFASLFTRAEELASGAREVRASADELTLLTETAPIGIFRTDAEDRYVYTNARWSEIMGLPPGEAIGTQWDTIAAPEDRLRFVTSLTDDPVTAGEQWKRFGFALPGPIDRIVLVTAKPVLDVDGEVSGWVGTLADVTDAAHEQEAVEARHVAEEKYRRIVETTTDGIWVIDAENRTTFVNQAMAEMLRTSVEDMDRHPMGDFYDKLEGPVIEASIERQRAGVSGAIDVRLRRRDGTVLHAAMSTSPIFDENGMYDGSLAIVRDLAERMEQDERRKALEEQLRQSQRLESIGQLTGGIAHDFNNLLLGIRGFCELALGRLRRGEDTAGEYVEDILEAADRATLLTKQLLAFGRRQVLQPEVLDLRHVVASMERLLRQLVGDHVELVVSSPETPVLVEADRSQLEQVIMNLAVNARDAIGDGGVLTIAVSLSSGQVPEATLAVSDTGCGMDAETMARVFEPFYSTKGDSGTGLGLATVHGIVSQSGGRLGLDSAPGAGTTFSVFLPLSAGAKPPSAATPAAGASEGGADTILVVEDDPMVRTIVTAILDDLGYRVLKADGGEAALELAAAWESEIDLILTDLVMPGMSGRETAERVRERFPAAKILYMSGYTDDVVIRGGAFDPGTAFIQKPFGANELGRAVSDALSLELA